MKKPIGADTGADTIVVNAVIESASIEAVHNGVLTAWIYLDYGGSGQGFGGYALYLPKSYRHHKMSGPAGHFIFRCMEIAGAESWEKMKGRTIRVEKDGQLGPIISIGHIVKDDWFCPNLDFKDMRER